MIDETIKAICERADAFVPPNKDYFCGDEKDAYKLVKDLHACVVTLVSELSKVRFAGMNRPLFQGGERAPAITRARALFVTPHNEPLLLLVRDLIAAYDDLYEQTDKDLASLRAYCDIRDSNMQPLLDANHKLNEKLEQHALFEKNVRPLLNVLAGSWINALNWHTDEDGREWLLVDPKPVQKYLEYLEGRKE